MLQNRPCTPRVTPAEKTCEKTLKQLQGNRYAVSATVTRGFSKRVLPWHKQLAHMLNGEVSISVRRLAIGIPLAIYWCYEIWRYGMTIYFISDGEHLKIGYTKGSAQKRLTQLQTGNSRALQLVATMPGGMETESELHNHFSPYRLTGEWFAIQQESLRSLAGIEFAQASAGTLVAAKTKPSVARKKKALAWVPVKSIVAQLEKDADEVNGQKCRQIAAEWFKDVYNRVLRPSGLAMVTKDVRQVLEAETQGFEDCEESLAEDEYTLHQRAALYPEEPWLKYPSVRKVDNFNICSKVIRALDDVFGVDSQSLNYEPSPKYYRTYKRWFAAGYFNDEAWAFVSEEVSRLHGKKWVNQRADAFYDLVDRSVLWAHLDNDSPYLALTESDKRKYFNVLVLHQGMYRMKHRIEEQIGQYVSEYESALGFYDWANDYCMGPEYNEDEDEYRLRT